MAAIAGPVRVAILTTRSLVTIQRIEPETQSTRSVMCINRTSVEAGVSRAYNQFVSRGTGVISKVTGVPAFRIDVDGEVTDGRSFELPVFLAHRLRCERRLAGSALEDRPAELWVATGEVDADHCVKPVDGIAQKLKVLESWLASAPPDRLPVRLLLPAGNRTEAGGLAAIDSRSVTVQFLDHTDQASTDNVMTSPHRSSRAPMVVAAVVLFAVLAAAGFLLQSREPSRTALSANPTTTAPPASSAPSASAGLVVVREVRSATDKCYGGERRETDHSAPLGGEVVLSGAGRLCRLEAVSGDAHYAYLVARNGATMVPTDLGSRGSLASKVITDESVLEVVFSAQPLQEGADVSRLPRIVIRINPS